MKANQPNPAQQAPDYTDIANRAQDALGRGVHPSTAKAVIEAYEAARELTAAQGVSDVDVLAELIAAVEQYLTTRIPSYERISKAFKAWKSANG